MPSNSSSFRSLAPLVSFCVALSQSMNQVDSEDSDISDYINALYLLVSLLILVVQVITLSAIHRASLLNAMSFTVQRMKNVGPATVEFLTQAAASMVAALEKQARAVETGDISEDTFGLYEDVENKQPAHVGSTALVLRTTLKPPSYIVRRSLDAQIAESRIFGSVQQNNLLHLLHRLPLRPVQAHSPEGAELVDPDSQKAVVLRRR